MVDILSFKLSETFSQIIKFEHMNDFSYLASFYYVCRILYKIIYLSQELEICGVKEFQGQKMVNTVKSYNQNSVS